jgi:hypothetical protein
VTVEFAPTAALAKTAHWSFDGGGLTSWNWLVEQTPKGIDLSRREDRKTVHRFLNRWGCRLKLPKDSQPSYTENALDDWWAKHQSELESLTNVGLERLHANQISTAAACFHDLAERAASDRRRIGPTAASKVLLALGPQTFPAWDSTIARSLYGGVTTTHFENHLTQCSSWAKSLLKESEIQRIVKSAPRFGIAKLIDETLYYKIVRKGS